MSGDGGAVAPTLALAGAAPGGSTQLAQAPEAPIGTVEEVVGTVTLTRADGSSLGASVAEPVFANDVVTTRPASSVEIRFVDGTRFSLGQDGQMTLDQLVFDPGAGGELDLSVAQGAFTFITGAIAGAPGQGMEVQIPVGTIGIRGTTVGCGPVGTQWTCALLPDPDGTTGRVVIANAQGEVILDQALEATAIPSALVAPGQPVVLSRDQLVALFGDALQNLPEIIDQMDLLQSPEDETNPEAGEQRGEAVPTTPNTGGINEQAGETLSLRELTSLFTLSDEQGFTAEAAGFGSGGGFTASGGLGDSDDGGGPAGNDAALSDGLVDDLDPIIQPSSPELRVITGGPGDDQLDASDGGPAELIGLAGNDTLIGSAGDDILKGGEGDDTLVAGAGDDQVFGEDGNDLIIGGSGEGNDALDGGPGADTIQYSSATQPVTVDLSIGTASGDPAIGQDTLDGIENVIGGQAGDTIIGNDAANTLDGGTGNDGLSGRGGDDTLIGGAGDDRLTGGAGDDVLAGGDGSDTAFYSGVTAAYVITLGAEGAVTVSGPDGTDSLTGIEFLSFTDQVVSVADLEPSSNQAPTAISLSSSTIGENATGAVVGTLAVADPDAGDSHSFVVSDDRFEVVGGALQLKAGEALDFEAEPQVTLTVTAIDSGGLSTSQPFTIAVIDVDEVNDPPTAVDDPGFVTAEDTPLAISAGELIGNDSDPENDALTITSVGSAVGGTVAFDIGGQIVFTPDAQFSGPASFTYTVSDGQGGEDTAEVSLTVTPVNDDPDAVDDGPVETAGNTAVIIAVLANDSDIEGDDLSVTAVSAATNGVAVINGEGTITYMPNVGFSGSDSFTYTASDGQGGTDTATVTVNVAPNLPPDAADAAASGLEDGGPIAVTLMGTDADGAIASVTLTSLPAGGTLYADAGFTQLAATEIAYQGPSATFYFVPAVDFNGQATFQYSVTDDDGATDATPATATITVAAVNDGVAIVGIGSPAGDKTVDEDDLAEGSSPNAAALTQAGTFTIEAADGIDDLTIGGVAAVTNGVLTLPGSPIATAHGALAIVELDLEAGVVSYSYTLVRPASSSAPGEDAVLDEIPVVLSDVDGDTTEASLTVRIVDDVPSVVFLGGAPIVLDETDDDADDGPGDGLLASVTVSAASLLDLDAGFGADGPGTVSFALDLVPGDSGLVDTASGEAVILALDAGDIVGRTATGGQEVFRISVDESTGQVTVTQVRAVVHGDPLDPDEAGSPATILSGLIGIEATIADGDGDVSTALADLGALIRFGDDGPTAVGDTDTVAEDGFASIGGNVAANDSAGSDGIGSVVWTGATGDAVAGAYGLLTVDSDGSYFYALDNGLAVVQALAPGHTLTESFDYTLTDHDGDASSATLTITITGSNDAPVITSDGGGAVASIENTTPVTTVTATDVDAGQVLTFSIAGGADSSLFEIDPATGALSFLAAPDFEAPGDTNGDNVYEVVVGVSDGAGGGDLQLIEITVTNIDEAPDNTPPVITSDGGGDTASASVEESSTAVTTVVASDPDTDQTLAFSIAGGADAGLFTIDPQTGVLSFIAAPDFETPADAGGDNIYDVEIAVADGAGGTDAQAISVTVTDVDEPPSPVTDTDAVVEQVAENAVLGTAVGITALSSDPDLGDTVTYSLTDDAGGRFQIDAATGVVTVANGSLLDFESDASHQITVQASDGTLTSSQAFTISVVDVNEAPLAAFNSGLTDEDTVLNVASPGVLGNDSDPDGDSLMVVAVNGSPAAVGATIALDSGARLTLHADGSYSFDPNGAFDDLAPGQFRTNSFTYTVADLAGLTSTATVEITVAGINDAPDAVDDGLMVTAENTAITIAVLDNDTDAEDDIRSIIEVGEAANGVAIVNGDGTITYTPNAGFSGIDSFTYTVSDGAGGSDSATVTIEVSSTDHGVEIIGIGSTAGDETVHENDLPDGTSPDPAALTQTGTFSIGAVDGVAALSIGGFLVVSDGDVTLPPAPIATDYGLLAITGVDLVTGVVSYAYTLTDNTLDHGLGGDSVFDEIAVVLSDEDDDTATSSLIVRVVNDKPTAVFQSGGAPIVLSEGESDGDDGPGDGLLATVTISIAEHFALAVQHGADGPGETIYFLTLAPGAESDLDDSLTGEPILLSQEGNVIFGRTSGEGLEVFRISLDESLGEITITQSRAIAHAGTGETALAAGAVHVGNSIFDGDGDQTGAGVDLGRLIRFADDGPVVIDDVDSITEDVAEAATGTVLTNDSAGTDGIELVAWTGDGAGEVAGLYGTLFVDSGGNYGYALDNGLAAVQALAPGQTLTDAFTYELVDGDGSSAGGTLTITVFGTNDAPVITSDGGAPAAALNVAENGTAVTQVTATDVDAGQTLVFSIVGGDDASLFTIDPATGALSFLAAPDFETPGDADGDNVYEVEIGVADGAGGSDVQTLLISVTDVGETPDNFDPVITSNGAGDTASIALVEGTDAVTVVTATDDDPSQGLTFSIVGAADAALFVIDPGTGALSFLTAPDFEAPADAGGDNVYDVEIGVSDGAGGTDTQTLGITVTDENEAPSLPVDTDGGPNQVAENAAGGTAVGITAFAGDPDFGDHITYTLTDLAGRFQIDAETGIVTVAAGVLLDYETATSHEITVTASDGALTRSQTFTITVTNVNEAPLAVVDSPFVEEDTPTVVAAPGPLANDEDPDAGDTLTIVAVNGSATLVGVPFALTSGAILTLNADGSYVYDPNGRFESLQEGQVGFDSVEYTIADSGGLTSTASIGFQIVGANDTPDAEDDGLVATEVDTPVTVFVLNNDLDVDQGTVLTITQAGPAGNGTVAINSDGTITYTPNEGFSGADSFTYTVSDGAGGSDTATVSVNVIANVPPVADNLALEAAEDTGLITVQLTGSDADGDVVAVRLTSLPGNGTLYSDPAATIPAEIGLAYAGGAVAFYFVSDANFHGEVSFQYTVIDDDGAVDATPATVTIDVLSVPDQPSVPVDIDPDPNTVHEDAPAGTIVHVEAQSTDGDGEAVTYSLSDDAGGRFQVDSTTGVVSVAPGALLDFETEASHHITVVASDGTLTNSQTFTITIIDVNEAPAAETDEDSTDEDTIRNATLPGVLVNDTDPDAGDTLTVTAVNGNAAAVGVPVALASGALLTLNADGSYAYDPNGQFDGLGDDESATDSFEYTVEDSGGLTSTATVTITISGVNDAPVPVTLAASVTFGASSVLTGDEIDTTDEDSPPSAIVYTLVGLPAHGELRLNGVLLALGATFTQADVLAGLLAYAHDGSVGTSDFIEVDISDGENVVAGGVITVTIAQSGVETEGDVVQGDPLIVGDTAIGQLHIQAGGSVAAGQVIAGNQSTGDGTILVNGPDSELVVGSGGIVVANQGAGSLVIENLATVQADGAGRNVVIGEGPDSSGLVRISGAGSSLIAKGADNELSVVHGELRVESGGLVSALFVNIGVSAGSDAIVTVTGAGSKLVSSNDFGLQSGDNAIYGGFIRVGREDGSHGTLNVLDGAVVEIRSGETVNTDTIGAGMTVAGGAGSSGTVLVSGAGSRVEISQLASLPSDPENIYQYLNGAFLTIGAMGQASVTVTAAAEISIVGNEPYLGVGGGNFDDPEDDTGTPQSTLLISNSGRVSVTETLSGEAVGNDGGIYIGDFLSGNGKATVTGTGSSLTTHGSGTAIYVGAAGDGILEVLDGGLAGTQFLVVSDGGASSGVVNISGPGSRIDITNDYGIYLPPDEAFAAYSVVGRNGGSHGEVHITNGGLLHISQGAAPGVLQYPGLMMGRNVGSEGYVSVSGDGSEIRIGDNPQSFGSEIVVGRDGFGSLSVSDNAVVTVQGEESGIYVSTAGAQDPATAAIQSLVSITSGGQVHLVNSSTEEGGFIVAAQQYGNGKVVVDGEGSLLHIESSFALSIGHRGIGFLEVTNGADVDIHGGSRVGQYGHGTALVSGAGSTLTTSGADNTVVAGSNEGSTGQLTVADGGLVRTLDLRAGRGGDGTITITGDGSKIRVSNDTGLWSGEFSGEGPFVGIGRLDGSNGLLEVLAGGLLEVEDNADTEEPGIQIAREAGSTGAVIVDGVGSEIVVTGIGPAVELGGPYIDVGTGGDAALTIQNGGSVLVTGDEARVGVCWWTSGGDSGTGIVTVTGAGSTLSVLGSDAAMFIGDAGSASVVIENGGTLNAGEAHDGDADVYVYDRGAIDVEGGQINADVEIDGGALVVAGSGIGDEEMNGDLLFSKGWSALLIEAAGAGAGLHDQLTVTGDVNLTVGVISFSFLGAYLPVAGDSFTFLTAASLAFDPSGVSYAFWGVDPLFDFTVTQAGNSLVFTALDNATAGAGLVHFGGSSDGRIIGSDANDTLFGGAGSDDLDGGDGDDLLDGGDGFDTLYGGAGNDTLDVGAPGEYDNVGYWSDPSGVIINLSDVVHLGVAPGTARDGFGDTDTLIGALNVSGSEFDDRILGGAADEIMHGNGGNDFLDGGGGWNSLDFFGSEDGVAVDLNIQDGVASQVISESQGSDTIVNFSAVLGSFHNDTIIGTSDDNYVGGRGGNDTFMTGGGNDNFDGDEGDDRIVLTTFTFAQLNGGTGEDTIVIEGADNLIDLTAIGTAFTGFERIDIGGSGDNTILLQASDVLSLSDTDQLLILGDAGDVYGLADAGWAFGGEQAIDGESYNVFTASVGSDLATLLIDADMSATV